MQEMLHSVSQATSLDGLWHMMLEFFRDQGFFATCYMVPQPGATFAVQLKQDGFPESWHHFYLDNELAKVDPILHYALQTGHALRWSDIGNLTALNPAQRHYLDLLDASELTDGVSLPTYGPAHRQCCFAIGMVNDPEALAQADLPMLHTASQAVHLKICELTAPPSPPVVPLSTRESEVLYWVAMGKSNYAIAGQLDIATDTVDTHLRRIFRKLHVGDRTSAAVKGVANGLITVE